jgi:NhaP-type Na+/H+ or K+/H+ antiporter
MNLQSPTMDWTMTFAASAGGGAALSIALILVLGVVAQWVSWRARLPSILLLLLAGLVAGPVMRHWMPGSIFAIDPDSLFGDLLMPLVGISVGLILYEGGLTLSFKEIRAVRRTVVLLVSAGALATWAIAGLSASLLLGMPLPLAVLLGAIIVVTGPTVIGPLLSHIRPAGSVGPILKWEGIVIDPIGVTLAVLVFEAVRLGSVDQAAPAIAMNIVLTVLVGGGLGVFAAFVLLKLMSRFLLPDFLQNPFSLMLVVATFVGANQLQTESGLLATTVMGIVLANQSKADVRHILEFKENLRVLLISALFIVLGARLDISTMQNLNWFAVAGFVAVLIVIARPACVAVSTLGSGLSTRERIFLALMAPRGIVAAAGAAIFSLELEQEVARGTLSLEGVSELVPVTFSVIVATVAFYGLVAPMLAKRLGVSDENPQGIVFVGASAWVRAVAAKLKTLGVRVLLVDTNRINVRAARMEHLDAWHGSILADYAMEALDLRGIGRALALTSNDEVNALALQRFGEQFDSAELFTLPARVSRKDEGKAAVHGGGRHLFDSEIDLDTVETRFEHGWVVKATTLGEEFTYEDWRVLYGPKAIVMFAVSPTGVVWIASDGGQNPAEPGWTIIGLVNPDELIFG